MKNKINMLTALICAFALSVVSLNFVEAATGTSGFTYKSQGRIVFTNDNSDPADDVVFDASDFTTIDQVVANGKNQVMSKLNEYKDENGNSKLNLSGLQSFDDLANAVDTLTSGSNAAADQILAGYKAMVGKNIVTGTMVNNGAVTQSLNAGGSYTIPKGYHDGTGKVTANSLASQTSATAVDGDILSGQTAWVNGNKITGSMPNQGAISGTISPGGNKAFSAGYYSGGTVYASACTSTHVNNQDGGTVTPGTSNKTITPDSSHTGLSQVVVAGDSDLIAENIKSGVNIFGVDGSLNSSSSMDDVANIITNAEVVGTVRLGSNSDPTKNTGPKYITYDSNYFSYSSSNYSVTLQPGTYLLIACLSTNGGNVDYANLQFADMNISGSLAGATEKHKVVTITSPTTYTHSQTVSTSYATGSCLCIKLN